MKNYSLISIILTAIIIMTCHYPTAKQGAVEGIKLCEEIIVPALLPILILTNIVIKSQCSLFFEKLFGWFVYYIFKLPKCSAPAIIFGLIGGYPAGAVLTNNLFEQGLINEETQKRIMRINFSGGLAFIITAVGKIMLGSAKLGVILYLSTIIPSLLTGFINSLFIKEKPNFSRAFYNPLTLNNALINSVESAVKSILNMSAYIILFSSICAIFPISSYIMPIIEITNGVYGMKPNLLEFIAFFLAFGGLCVHFQILNYLPNYLDFLIFRIINSVGSFAIMKLYMIINPIEQSVFLNQTTIVPKLTEANAGFGIIMILGCAVIVFDIENRKIKLR